MREFVARGEHRERVGQAARLATASHADALRRLGGVNEAVEFLDLDDIIGLAITLLGDPPPVRDIGLLGSAVATPRTTAFGEDVCAPQSGSVIQAGRRG